MGNTSWIYFLGFGYDNTNLKRLRIDELRKDKYIAGSGYRLGDSEMKAITNKWPIDVKNNQYDVLAYLKNIVYFK